VTYILVIVVLSSTIVTTEFTKCCPVGKHLNIHTKNCINGPTDTNEEDTWLNGTKIENKSLKTSEEHVNYKDVPIKDDYHCNQSLRYNFEPLIIKNDSIYLVIDSQTNRKLRTTEVCLDHAVNHETSNKVIVAQACLPCSQEHPCINYCCPEGTVSKDGECIEDQYLTINITQREHKKLNILLHCIGPVIYPRKLWQLNSYGEMNIDGKVHDASEYCVGGEDSDDPWLLLCPETDEKVDYKKIIRMMFMCLSLGSIILIIFFHVIIEDLWTNRFTFLKIPLYLCLFISFLITIITNLKDFRGSSICVILALLLQYFSLAIFFWLTSMSFYIWLGFQNKEIAAAEQRRRMKLLYGFSFGGPFLITFVTAVLQFIEKSENSPYIHPSIGVACMIGQYLPQFLYWHLIILILLCVNCVFYCSVVFNFTCGIWKQCSYGTNQLRNFRILLELIFPMGINWFSEVITFFIGWQYPAYWDHPLLILINSVNWIIGVILLLAFCWKLNNRNLIRKIFLGEESDIGSGRTFNTQLSESNQSNKELIQE